MSWWQSLLASPKRPPVPGVTAVHVALDGWTLATQEERTARWYDAADTALMLDIRNDFDLAHAPPPSALQAYFRRLAEAEGGGLIEAVSADWRRGLAAHGIYKKPKLSGFTFIGILHMPLPAASLVWAIGATERDVTGVREALVVAQHLERGTLSLEELVRDDRRDPYDPHYRALGRVDPRTLRFPSDDEAYDAVVPGHPLSRVRAAIRSLRETVDVDPAAFGCEPPVG